MPEVPEVPGKTHNRHMGVFSGTLGTSGGAPGHHLGPKWEKGRRKRGRARKKPSLLETLSALFAKKWAYVFGFFFCTLQNASLRDVGTRKALQRRPKGDLFVDFLGCSEFSKNVLPLARELT